MSTTTRAARLTFQVWDFSTASGGGYAVIRESGRCEAVKRTDAVRQGALLGIEWHGTMTAIRNCWSVEQAEARYRRQFTVPVEIVRCMCGCLLGTTDEERRMSRNPEHCGQEWCCG